MEEICQHKFNKKSGRPVKTTIREQRLLMSMCKKDPHKTARELQSEWNTENECQLLPLKEFYANIIYLGEDQQENHF